MTPQREPALYLGAVASLLALLVAIKWHGLTHDQATLIVAAIGAVGGVVTAVLTRPIAPAAFTTLVVTVADLLAGFHYNVDPGTIAAINGLILAGLALLTRVQVSPAPVLEPRATIGRG